MLPIIAIKEFCRDLGYKDARAVVRWCERQGIQVISFPGSKPKFVLKAELESVILQKFRSPEESQNRNNQLSKSQTTKACTSLSKSRNTDKNSGFDYHPQGTIESDFLSILQNI